MKYLAEYDYFLVEKLGYNDTLEIICDDIISKIKNHKYLKYTINYLDYDLTINILIDHNKNLIGDFQVENKYVFNIRLNKLDKSTLIHELKHLDRCIRRNFKTDTYFYIKNIGSLITNNYKFLFKSENDINFLLDTFYFCNPEEFESQYHNLSYDIKNEIKSDNTNKYNTIRNIIENEYIYKLYKYYYESSFDLLDFFKSKKDCEIFLEEFIRTQDLFYNKSDYEIKIIHKIKNWFKSKINFLIKNEIKNKNLLKQFNYLINTHIKKNYKKFFRLYII